MTVLVMRLVWIRRQQLAVWAVRVAAALRASVLKLA
jgi:hypothetical protein